MDVTQQTQVYPGPDATDLKILAYVRDFIAEQDYPPTFQEVGRKLGLAKSTVWYRCQRLRSAGLLNWRGGSNRTLKLTEAGEITAEVE